MALLMGRIRWWITSWSTSVATLIGSCNQGFRFCLGFRYCLGLCS
jgi:hypothetical protein